MKYQPEIIQGNIYVIWAGRWIKHNTKPASLVMQSWIVVSQQDMEYMKRVDYSTKQNAWNEKYY